jgi:hypothetical protein
LNAREIAALVGTNRSWSIIGANKDCWKESA